LTYNKVESIQVWIFMKLKIVHLVSHKNKLALTGREKPKSPLQN